MLTFIFTLWMAFWQSSTIETAKLEKLVQERQVLHQQWQNSESKKSGIFGNRTKKDMIETNEWLERILAKDNQIIEELKFSGQVKTEMIGQEKDDYKTITQSLERDVQVLKKALAEKDKEIENKLDERRVFEWASFILFISTIALGLWIYRLKKS
ncbi:hypothetical protein DFQ04_2152 [Algoriphagus boseongensis]|uniref:Clp protease ClpB n=1 Tax=Algoriphagus boseongensis TaxID=1442587 RepID=A0A4R6T941_9BACT|nr:Clp protease ClpB [Algoriphagus boseongensis]TDQ17498.1 hypothetical protein DFQ04_2152 [Algoriphagus boseongensis]